MKYIKVQLEFQEDRKGKIIKTAIVKTYRYKDLNKKLEGYKLNPNYKGYSVIEVFTDDKNIGIESE